MVIFRKCHLARLVEWANMERCFIWVLVFFAFNNAVAQNVSDHESLNSKIPLDFLTEQLSHNETEYEHASKYPMILHHGIFGFTKILFLEYFNGVPSALRNLGYEVYVTKVNPIGSVKERARQLAQQIDKILALSGKEKVNIIAHSMGGLDSRYLISRLGYGDRVASLSMISTPNHGSYIAEKITYAYDLHKKLRKAMIKLMNFPNKPTKSIIQQTFIAISDCSEKMVKEFNQVIQNQSSVYYQSWAGRTSTKKSETTAALDPLFFLPYWILREKRGNNDGLISVNSARWGHFKGVISADHLDQIGFWWKKRFSKFRYRMFYQKVASGLARQGF